MHRATLEDGAVVAVKVRRPGVVETVARDFALIEKVLDVNSKFAKGVTGGLDVMSMVKALSPRVNILNNFTERVRGSLSLNLEDIDPRNIDLTGVAGPALMKLLQNLENTAELPTKTVEVLDMLEKGQIKVRSDLGFEDKGLHELTCLMRDGFIAVMAMALFIGSCIICVMPVDPSIQRVMGIPVLGFVGYLLGIGCMIYAARRIGKGR